MRVAGRDRLIVADERAQRVADLIAPLRVKPGSHVNLARDFDPGYRAGLLGTTDLNMAQFAWALVPAIALLVLWEAGKFLARRGQRVRLRATRHQPVSAKVVGARPSL